MTVYPKVLSEVETLAQVCSGRSLARYGDGELNLCIGGRAKAQAFSATLRDRLVGILQDSGDCLVGIPNIQSETPKAAFWQKYRQAARLLADRPYVSAFISRPDSAPWIHTRDYWQSLESLWVGHDVTLVRGSSTSLTAQDLVGARRVREIVADGQNAWSRYASLLARIGTPDRALLCLGPTATVMAVDLCAAGVHAIDIGHIGMFLRKQRRGEPMTVTAKDRNAA